MSVFKIDGSGALIREGGRFVRTDGLDEIRQGNQVGVLMVRGEVPTNVRLGLPWFGDPRSDAPGLLGKDTPPEVLGSRVRSKLDSRKGVVEVTDLTVTPNPNVPDAVAIAYTARVSTDKLARDLLRDEITVGG